VVAPTLRNDFVVNVGGDSGAVAIALDPFPVLTEFRMLPVHTSREKGRRPPLREAQNGAREGPFKLNNGQR
jgi:hypothetical protein